MTLILNNQTTSPIFITEFSFDMIKNEYHIRNENSTYGWSSADVAFLLSLVNTSITSIEVLDSKGQSLKTYNNLTGILVNINEHIQEDYISLSADIDV